MEEKDHKIIIKSFTLRLCLALMLSLAFIICSIYEIIMFGVGVTFILSFPFFYTLSGKLFPDSLEFLSDAHRDYLRLRKGLKGNKKSTKIKAHYFDDFKRG